MRRTSAIVAVAAVALAAGAAAATAGPPPLRASVQACGSGLTADERFAVFTGSMPAMRRTARMAMRFDVLERRAGRRRWARVRAPKLGRWERSGLGREGFVYTKRVDDLRPRASYRAVVRFRWLDASGRVQRRARRTTGVCRQPDPRPNLRVEALDVGAQPDGSTRYAVRVHNAGRGPARRFAVLVRLGPRAPLAAFDVPALSAGERVTLEAAGPSCPAGHRAEALADPSDRVAEARETDNRLSAACPASSSG